MRVPIPVPACAVVGPLLFVVSFLVQGALRRRRLLPAAPPRQRPSYGLYGWVQQASLAPA